MLNGKCTSVPAKDRKHVAKPDDIVMKWKDADQAVGFLKTDAVSYRTMCGSNLLPWVKHVPNEALLACVCKESS